MSETQEKKLTALSEQTGYSTIASPSSNLAIHHVTVDDMINWLRIDGFYRGLVGWSTQFSPEEIFRSPSQIQDLPESTKKTAQDSPLEDGNVGLHFALDQATREADQEKHIRRMIQEHRRLIPAAVREVERRLILAGVPMEEVRKMGRSDAASSIFVKLGRLEQTQRPAQLPLARVRIQVVCDIGGMDDQGGLWKMDLYIPRNCLFDEFEDILHRHAYVKGILEVERIKTPEHNNDNYDAGEQGQRKAIEERKPRHQVLQGKYVRHTVWGYRIVGKDDTNVLIEDDGRWIALCDQDDFTKLMKVAVRDSSKTALICHETTLERPPQRAPTPPSQWKDVGPQDLDDLWANWESGTFHLDPIDWELEDWDVGGYRPLGDDFDWSGVLNETGSPKG